MVRVGMAKSLVHLRHLGLEFTSQIGTVYRGPAAGLLCWPLLRVVRTWPLPMHTAVVGSGACLSLPPDGFELARPGLNPRA